MHQLKQYLRRHDGALPSVSMPRPDTQSIDFVFIETQPQNLQAALLLLQRVIDSFEADQDVFIGEIVSTCVLAHFRDSMPVGRRKREAQAMRLLKEFGTGIRIVHGKTDAAVGNFGGSNRFHYGALSLQAVDHLRTLATCEYGEAREVP
jgi:hypothetical protein